MENSSSETPAPNPRNYENEVRTFRQESTLTREMQEDYKREALRKCNDLHAKLLDCYEKKYFCGTAEKEFWDCYRRERVCHFSLYMIIGIPQIEGFWMGVQTIPWSNSSRRFQSRTAEEGAIVTLVNSVLLLHTMFSS